MEDIKIVRWITWRGRHIPIGEDNKIIKFKNKEIKNINSYMEDEYKIYNKQLKEVKNYEELEKFNDELWNSGEGLRLRTKRAKWMAYSFSKMDDNKVSYLISDGVSIGKSKIENLYKYLEVSDRSR